ncbi:hypothetical protein M409DRAFT_51189 [Zasmidium cellare ATCC 36951]|uniref:Uncharacterized protein n=1 Tax=Zasmidium cellare ATCC 36951 TaxID=1080233 RepID=A0A6A6CUV2_ZASCE|nr:uncharacterized protein M409DRAFT_51189 [Zasmidium cellare ATCC 36951]KAF2170947.1 hypothetical protein M409DRAFT_51189 [Zasmidium cellare ATCC 36951]
MPLLQFISVIAILRSSFDPVFKAADAWATASTRRGLLATSRDFGCIRTAREDFIFLNIGRHVAQPLLHRPFSFGSSLHNTVHISNTPTTTSFAPRTGSLIRLSTARAAALVICKPTIEALLPPVVLTKRALCDQPKALSLLLNQLESLQCFVLDNKEHLHLEMATDSKKYGCSYCDFESNNFTKAKHHIYHSNKSGGRFICSCEEFKACFFEQLTGEHGHFSECDAYAWESRTLGISLDNSDQLKETCDFSKRRPREDATLLALFGREEEDEGGQSGEDADDEMSASGEDEQAVDEHSSSGSDDEVSIRSDSEVGCEGVDT